MIQAGVNALVGDLKGLGKIFISLKNISSQLYFFFLLLQYKKNVTDSFAVNALPLFEDNSSPQLKPIIDSVCPFHKVADAHRHMESNQNTGKIVLQVRHEQTGNVLLRDEL